MVLIIGLGPEVVSEEPEVELHGEEVSDVEEQDGLLMVEESRSTKSLL